MKKIRTATMLIILAFVLFSCDAYRLVRISNLSDNDILIKTDYPHRTIFDKDSTGVYKESLIMEDIDLDLIRKMQNNNRIDTLQNDFIIRLQPHQFYDVTGCTGPAFGGIRPSELRHTRLSIYTATDTIIAKDKNEIIDLFDDPKTEYIKQIDQETLGRSNKRMRYIVIRE